MTPQLSTIDANTLRHPSSETEATSAPASDPASDPASALKTPRPSTAPGTSASDRVFEVLRHAIIEGRIPAGSKLSEPALASSHAVSRAPLREAIGRLEALGLVERRARVGARVVELTGAGLVELYEIREALEGTAARLAAERMPAAEVDELLRLVDAHRERVARESGRAYFQQEGDLDFHYRIVHGSGNRRLIRILCNDLYHLMRMYRCQFGMRSHRAPAALKEHALLADAIAAGDGELAEWLMRRHVRASRVGVEQALRAEQPSQIQGKHSRADKR